METRKKERKKKRKENQTFDTIDQFVSSIVDQ